MEPSGLRGERQAGGERYRFDGVLVDAVAHTLSRDGASLPVEPKAFAVLLALLRHRGELVPRDELLDHVWGHRHVTPGVLTRAIAQLRAALGDDAHEPRYIQTVHALGYRFVGALEADAKDEPAETGSGASPRLDEPASTPPPLPGSPVDPPIEAPPVHAALANAPLVAGPPVVAPAVRRWRVRHTWMAAAAVLAIALATSLWWNRNAGPALPGDASVAVLPFASLSGNDEDRYFAQGLAVEMHDALAGVPGVKVAAIDSADAARRRHPSLQALGRAIGVATVLDASVRRDGERVRINARLVDTRSGFTLWSDSFDREPDDVFAVQGEIAGEVTRALLGVLPRDGEGLRERLAPTRELGAYEAYLHGQQRLREAQDDAALQDALGYFRRALMIDRGFSRARAGVCRVEIKRFEATRDTPAFERARSACEAAAKMAPGLREVSLALGEMHRVRGDNALAIEHYTRALDDLSLRPAAWVGLAATHSAQGEDAMARAYYARALEMRPGDAGIHRELGVHQYSTGDIDGAIASFTNATGLLPDDATLWASLGGLYLARGDADRAAEGFNRSLAIAPSYGALSNLGTLRYGQGLYGEAAMLYQRAARLDPSDFRIWGNIGDALVAGDAPDRAAAAAKAYARAAGMAAEYLAVKPGDAQAAALLGWYRANLGQRDPALADVAHAEALGTEQAEVALINAQTLALVGDVDGARGRMQLAREAGIPDERIESAPVLRALGTGKDVSLDDGRGGAL